MEKTCPSCNSCGMPLEKASDYALADTNHPFCVYCTNEKGKLKPYEEILSSMVDYLVHSQGITMIAAKEMARDVLAKQPAWKNHHAH